MPFYVWWAIPLVATLIAVVWLSWRAREREIDPHDSLAERRRFIAAMEAPPVGRRPARPDGVDADSHSDLDDGGEEPTTGAGRGASA